MFMYFLYNHHLLFHMKVFEISFPNSRLFPHADDPLLQKISSELAGSGAGIEGTRITALAS